MNCSSRFSAEKAESGEIASQQILALVAVRVCMCVPMAENISKLAPCLPAHVIFIPGGGP